MDALVRHEVFPVPSVGRDPLLARYRISISMAPVQNLKLRYLHWLHSLGDLPSLVSQVLHLVFREDTDPVLETH
jgi:hypothetical protein